MPYYFHLPKYYPNFDDPLHKAAYLGDNNAIKKILKSNTVCIYKLIDNFTAFGIALAQNHQPIEIVNIYKKDTNAVRNFTATNTDYLPPILVAFGKNQVKKFKTMSKRCNKNESKPIVKKMTVLLKESNYECDVVDITPIDIVDAIEIVNDLLPNGCLDLNHQMKSDKDVVSFVHLAAMNGMTDLVRELIGLGANLEVNPNEKLIPLNLAIANGQLEMVKFLIMQTDYDLIATHDKQLIADAVDANEYQVFEYLIEFFAAKKQEKESMTRIDALRLLMPNVEALFMHLPFANVIFHNVDYRMVLDLSNMLHRCALNSAFTDLGMEMIKFNFDWLLVERDDNYLQQSVTAFHMIVSQGWSEIQTIYREYPAAKKILFSNASAACRALDYGLCLHQISEDLAEFLFKTHRNEIIEMNLISSLLSSSIKRTGYNKLIDLLLEYASNSSSCDVDFSKPILTSLEYRNYDITERLLNCSINPNENIINVRDENGNNLLYHTMWKTPRRQSRYAMCCNPPKGTHEQREHRRRLAREQLERICEKLLHIGVDFNHRNTDNQTLLHRAVLCGDEKSVEKYLHLGVPVDASDNHRQTAMHLALNTNIFHQLIKHALGDQQQFVNAKDNNGDTVLHHMIKELDCDRELLKNVIAYGADVNAKNNEQRTPLFYVVSDECAQLLLEFGANPNVRDSNDSACIDVLDQQNQPIKSLIESKNLNILCIENGHGNLSHFISFPDLFTAPSDQIKELIKTQCNTVDVNGSPMLCVALFQRNENCVKLLLNESKIDVNAKDSTGLSAIHLAYNCPNLIEDLLSKGAEIDALDNNGWTPLQHALKWNCNDAARKFLTAGANVNIQNLNGDTAMHFSAQTNNFPLMIDIIKRNGNWTICNEQNKIAFDLFDDLAIRNILKNIL